MAKQVLIIFNLLKLFFCLEKEYRNYLLKITFPFSVLEYVIIKQLSMATRTHNRRHANALSLIVN